MLERCEVLLQRLKLSLIFRLIASSDFQTRGGDVEAYLDVLLLLQHIRHNAFQLIQLINYLLYFVKVTNGVLFGRKELITDSMNIL